MVLLSGCPAIHAIGRRKDFKNCGVISNKNAGATTKVAPTNILS
jgi:hypothetical protein